MRRAHRLGNSGCKEVQGVSFVGLQARFALLTPCGTYKTYALCLRTVLARVKDIEEIFNEGRSGHGGEKRRWNWIWKILVGLRLGG